MPKNGQRSGGKSKTQPAKTPPSPPAPPPSPPMLGWPQKSWLWVRKNAKTAGLIAVLSFFADVAQVSSVLPKGPEIKLFLFEAKSPFDTRFSVENPSVLFSFSSPEFSCTVTRAVGRQGLNIGNAHIRTDRDQSDMSPGAIRGHLCDMNYALRDTVPLVEVAQVEAKVEYKTFGIRRTATAEFYWERSTGHWQPGQPARH